MVSIEFVGPSGIGKTTFMQALLKERVDSSWITSDEGLRTVVQENHNLIEKSLVRAARLFGLSITLKNKNEYLDKLIEKNSSISLLIDLFIDNLGQNNLKAWQKIGLFDYYVKSVLYEAIILHESFKNETIIFDEGIIHNGGLTSVIHNFEKYQGIHESGIFPKGAIFFDLHVDQYRERLNARFQKRGERTINSLMRNVNEMDLERYMVSAKREIEREIVACRMLNLPILELEPILTKTNIKKALKFINDVSNN